MSDGAHMGVDAQRALGTVIGGEDQPAEDEQRDPVQMRDWLLASTGPPFNIDTDGYGECARYIGKLILEAFLADPRLASVPVETVYDWPAIKAEDENFTTEIMRRHVLADGLYEVLKRDRPETHAAIAAEGISGFQWGWAVNAARYCVELPPERNPAFL